MLYPRALALTGAALALAASCATTASPPAPPSSDPGPTTVQPSPDLAAVALGVTIDARDDRGAPRLVRAVAPRHSAAGTTPDQAARAHLNTLAPLWLSHGRASELTTQNLQRLRNGASVVRLQQQVDHIDIHQGELRVMLQPDGSLAAVSGTMRASASRLEFRSTATAAVERALDALYGTDRTRSAIVDAGVEHAGFRTLTVAAVPGIQVHSARVKQELFPDGDQLTPIWTVELIAEKTAPDDTVEASARRYLIADRDGRVLRDVNLTANDAFVYRAFADATGNRHPLDGALQSYNPHPTGTPDGTLPGPAAYNLVTMEAFNRPRDPWLPATATTTSGNNVDAYADIAPPTGFSDGDVRPVVRAGRVLNYRYDFNADPLATPEQSMAATVNAFFVTNWLHDWYYDSGFTEATGNAQVDNYGRGGVAGDPLIVRAQSGALSGLRDNANMTTPSDGVSPFMNMYLWSAGADSRLLTETATVRAVPLLNAPRTFDTSAEVVLALDENGNPLGCNPITTDVAGKIAFMKYVGACAGVTMTNRAKEAGAIGVLITIALPGATAVALNGSAEADIPGLVIGYDDGLAIEAALPTTVTLQSTARVEHDGDFDNAIVAHEWGHYMHLRLASCELTQCFAMSEGWGDFVALHMMLREGDNRDGTYGAGLYALTAGGMEQVRSYADPGYFGIRRYPYSVDRTKNALSFRHIGNVPLPDTPINPGPASHGSTEVHNAGQIWATMLWDVYNALVDEHGITEARRRMSDYVVSGLLLTPPNATYTEARDALLAAAGALDSDDMLLMAAAYAGRGAGTCAVSPPFNTGNFAGVVESGTIAARIETTTPTLTDDSASCDHDGHLDPGETGMLRLTIANSGIIPAESIVVRATTTAQGVTIGKPVSIPLLAINSQIDLAIPVQIARTAPTNTSLDIAVTIDGEAGCNTRHLTHAIHQLMGVDDVLATQTTDGFETSQLGWTRTGESAAELWTRTTDATGNHQMFGANASRVTDIQLTSPVLQASPTEPLVVTLKHAYSFEAGAPIRYYDGGVIEVSTDGGTTWRDVSELGLVPGYNGVIAGASENPLHGRRVFSAKSASYPALNTLTLDFGTQLAGQAVQLRFRIGTDACCSAVGWTVDDIAVTGITNKPFPGFVPEPAACLAPTASAAATEPDILELRSLAPVSLDGIPGAAEAL